MKEPAYKQIDELEAERRLLSKQLVDHHSLLKKLPHGELSQIRARIDKLDRYLHNIRAQARAQNLSYLRRFAREDLSPAESRP